jgi:hypothetical protein
MAVNTNTIVRITMMHALVAKYPNKFGIHVTCSIERLCKRDII